MRLTIGELNLYNREAFADRLGHIFEHSPWVAYDSWGNRPFESVEQLLESMMHAVRSAPEDKVTALLRAHPDLAARIQLTQNSAREQQGAGLDRLTPGEFATFTKLNREYTGKFGFPFILAVRGKTKEDIKNAMIERLAGTPEQERETALSQIRQIARLRLTDLVIDERIEEASAATGNCGHPDRNFDAR